MSKLSTVFANREYGNADDVLEHAKQIAPPKTAKPQLPRKELKRNLNQLLARGARNHHALVYALTCLGHSYHQTGKILELKYKNIAHHYAKAKRILNGIYSPRAVAASTPTFKNSAEFASHVEELSKIINQIERKKKPKPAKKRSLDIKPFHLEVLIAAQKHKAGLQTDIKKITDEFWQNPELRGGSETKEKLYRRIKNVLEKLTDRGLYASSIKRVATLRKATKSEIAKHLHLIDDSLRGKKSLRATMLMRRWRQFFTEREARSIALDGLIRAIETHDKKYPFEKHAGITIASRLADAVRQKIRHRIRESRNVAFESVKEEGKKAEQLEAEAARAAAKNAVDKDPSKALALIHSWHAKGLITPREAVVLALRQIHGNKHWAIGKHFNFTESRSTQIETAAKQKIRQAVRRAEGEEAE